jgi:peptidoglycan/xylan/chitin deacetylase (PgdA/CDA1 family)
MVALAVLSASALVAEVSFKSLDLNDKNQLLFQASVDAPVFGSYSAAFSADAAQKTITHLSYFPEQITWLGATQELQVQNRFGVFRSSGSLANLVALKGFPGFLAGGEIKNGKLGPVCTSPDGKFLIYQRQSTSAYGDLVMMDLLNAKETVISGQVELGFDVLPVRWSPDSSLFVFQKNNKIIYYSMNQYQTGRLLAENLRTLASGQVRSIQWGNANQLYLVSGSLVYEILAAELFTRSLYQDFLRIGRIVGRLPHLFDPNFDRFWVSPAGDEILLDKGGHSLFLYFLKSDDYVADGKATELPYLLLPRNGVIASVLWSSSGKITVLTKTLLSGGKTSSVIYRLDAVAGKSSYSFKILESPAARAIVLSPDQDRVALLKDDGLQLRSYETWQLLKEVAHPAPLELVFPDNDTIILAGRWYTERLTLSQNKAALDVGRGFLFFSQAEQAGFDKETGLVTLQAKDRTMSLDAKGWVTRSPFTVNPAQTANSSYRVYLESLYSGPYANLVMLRKAKEVGTFQLFDPPKTSYEDFPAVSKADAVSYDYFEHGSRQRQRQVSLTFNGIDSTDGLNQVLDTLADYNVRATFFLNGEFIRRYPGAAKEIIEAGHEVGSLFYMYFNLSDARYQITSDFIKQGLARNEDDFFDATGKEMGLLWRTPYYIVSDAIIKASQEMKYTLVGKDVDSLDFVSKAQNTGDSQLYYPSAKLVEMILEQKRPGSVIALTLGRPGYDDNPALGRDDYVFSHLDLLINNLMQRGYSLVPVSTLIEASR